MKKEEFSDAVNHTPENPDMRDRIISIGDEQNKTPMNLQKRLIVGIAAAVLITILGLSLPSLLDLAGLNASDDAPTAAVVSESTDPIVLADMSIGFTITACAADWEETVLQADVPMFLNEFSPTMSSIPGFPFRVDIPADSTIDKDTILIEVSDGEIVTWKAPDYTVTPRGQSYTCSVGDTIYWSPLTKDGSAISQCLMTITAFRGGETAAKAQIIISQNEAFSYNAELVSAKSYPEPKQ